MRYISERVKLDIICYMGYYCTVTPLSVLSGCRFFPSGTRYFCVILVIAGVFAITVPKVSAETIEARRVVGAEGQPAYENGCKAYGGKYGGAVFWKDPAGIVHTEGEVEEPSLEFPKVCFTFPAGDRPQQQSQFSTPAGSAGTVEILENGNLQQVGGSAVTVSLNGITFRAAEGSETWPTGGSVGPEGKEGKEGKEGPEGKEGSRGENGTNGGTELTAFTSEAKAELSEFKQGVETIGWCIVGTIIAAMVAWFTFSILRSRN